MSGRVGRLDDVEWDGVVGRGDATTCVEVARRGRDLERVGEVERVPLPGVTGAMGGRLEDVRSGFGADEGDVDVGVGGRRRCRTRWCYHVERENRVIAVGGGDESALQHVVRACVGSESETKDEGARTLDAEHGHGQ